MSTTAVESVTAQLGNVKVNDEAGDAQNHGGEHHEEISASAAEGRRLYIGNLAYATTEGELKEFFKDYLVELTSIPTNPRTNRPVGYAFVDLSTASEADRAISELDGLSILDRKVSVQQARRPGAGGEGAASGGEDPTGDQPRRHSTRGRGRGRGRGGRSFRGGRGSFRGSRTQEDGTEAPVNEPDQADPLANSTNETQGGQGEQTPSKDGKLVKPRSPRERRQRGPPEDGIPSKTKVMVANLPYDFGEEQLLEIFKDYQPSAAKIALRPIPRFMVKKLIARNEPRKGRGFGFVTLATEELQQKACEEMNGKDISGRQIAVKVAIDSPIKEEEAVEHSEEPHENGVTTTGETAVNATAA